MTSEARRLPPIPPQNETLLPGAINLHVVLVKYHPGLGLLHLGDFLDPGLLKLNSKSFPVGYSSNGKLGSSGQNCQLRLGFVLKMFVE